MYGTYKFVYCYVCKMLLKAFELLLQWTYITTSSRLRVGTYFAKLSHYSTYIFTL